MSLQDIYDFEGAIESAVCELLSDLPVVAAQSSRTVERTRVSVQFDYEGAESPTYQSQLQSDHYPQHRGTIRVSVVTQRNLNPRNEIEVPTPEILRTLHADYLTKIRTRVLRSALDAQLPLHQVVRLRPTGTERSFDSSGYEDSSTETWELALGIRGSAWEPPSSAPALATTVPQAPASNPPPHG